ncbi:hypothetical protein [Actinomadura gamaensis]|uniref:PLL-like beta propeller domain-containing protein n=1 Tax=Actinomadura gamaensis TaxID=1763541 RepID=A0ABV9TRW5_9ACTN
MIRRTHAAGAALTAGVLLFPLPALASPSPPSSPVPGPRKSSPSATPPKAPVGEPTMAADGITKLAARAQGVGSFFQVVAHEDDDTLFLYPDEVRHGAAASTTVFLTGGENDGAPGLDRCAFAEHRENGARAARAKLAGLPNSWHRSLLKLGTGRTVELDTLNKAPQVKLIFFRLHEAGNDQAMKTSSSLESLSRGRGSATTLGTYKTDGRCDPRIGNQSYSRARLLDSLAWLMRQLNVTVVLTQDPKSPVTAGNWTTDIYAEGDHTDHRGTGRLVVDAAPRYTGPGGNRHVLVRFYRGYNLRSAPADLGSLTGGKSQLFLTYLGKNGVNDPFPNPTSPAFYANFVARQYVRWSNGTSWAVRDGKGGISAFAVLNGQAAQWTQATPGGAWKGRFLDGAGLTPYITALRDAQGGARLFALRMADDAVVTGVVDPAGRWSGWTSLGNPDPGSSYMVGAPAATVRPNGDLAVFVRDRAGGVSAKTQEAGVWPSKWQSLGGSGVRDGVAATADASGRIEVFAPTTKGIAHWQQPSPSDPLTLQDGFPGDPPAGPITTAPGDATRIFYPAPGTAAMVEQRTDGSPPSAPTGPLLFEGASATRGNVLVGRTTGSGVMVGYRPSADAPYRWTNLDGNAVGAPTAVEDASGRVVVLAFTGDGYLYSRRATRPGNPTSFSPWTKVG